MGAFDAEGNLTDDRSHQLVDLSMIAVMPPSEFATDQAPGAGN
jgi:hypothetical protein